MINTDQLDIHKCLILKCPSLKIIVHHQLLFMNSSKSNEHIEKSLIEKFINIGECNNQKEISWCSMATSNHQTWTKLYVALDILK